MISKLPATKAEYLCGIAISVVAFVFYLQTLCPTVNFIDGGELATVAYTLGIAHPTGYPLFTLIGNVISHIPLGLRTIYQLNMMAALLCSASLFFFFRFMVFFLGELLQNGGMARGEENISESFFVRVFVPASAATLMLAFSETFWSQAVSIEVYSLHVFLLSVLLFIFLKAIICDLSQDNSAEAKKWCVRYWYLFAYVLGLAFTNHMTTILLAPAFLVLFFWVIGIGFRTWKKIGRMVIPFLLGFSVYLYLPIRASTHPLMNWGNPIDLSRFVTHWTGKVYRVWLFASTESAGKQLKYFIDTLPGEFAYIPLLFAVIGAWVLFKISKKIFVFTLLLFIGCVGYSINYDIHDIDSYFLLAYFTVSIWVGVGGWKIIAGLKNDLFAKWSAFVLLIIVVLVIIVNYPKVDESKTYIVEDYTKDMFNSIEQNGVVISYQWDYFVSAAYYLQLVEHYRPDVIVLDKELMRRSWYYNQLETRYPNLVKQTSKELSALLPELYRFEHDLPYNPKVIEFRYASMIGSVIEKEMVSSPVYVTNEIEPQYTQGFVRVPWGIPFRLFPDTLYHEIPAKTFSFRVPLKTDKYVEGIMYAYAQAYVNKAMYLSFRNQREEALDLLEKALTIWPDFREALALKQKILAKSG